MSSTCHHMHTRSIQEMLCHEHCSLDVTLEEPHDVTETRGMSAHQKPGCAVDSSKGMLCLPSTLWNLHDVWLQCSYHDSNCDSPDDQPPRPMGHRGRDTIDSDSLRWFPW